MRDEQDKARWMKLTDRQRLKELFLEWRYPHFALEIGLLFLTAVYLLTLRLSTYAEMKEDCSFV